jgi:hypothetical protein
MAQKATEDRNSLVWIWPVYLKDPWMKKGIKRTMSTEMHGRMSGGKKEWSLSI